MHFVFPFCIKIQIQNYFFKKDFLKLIYRTCVLSVERYNRSLLLKQLISICLVVHQYCPSTELFQSWWPSSKSCTKNIVVRIALEYVLCFILDVTACWTFLKQDQAWIICSHLMFESSNDVILFKDSLLLCNEGAMSFWMHHFCLQVCGNNEIRYSRILK